MKEGIENASDRTPFRKGGFLAAMLVLTALLVCGMVLSESLEAETGEGPIYGSTVEPYGSIDTSLEKITDDSTIYVVENGTVTIYLGEYATSSDIQIPEGSGLSADSGFITGTIVQTSTITVGTKTFTIQVVNPTGADLYPVYGYAVDDPNPYGYPEVGSVDDPLTSLEINIIDMVGSINLRVYYVQIGSPITISPAYHDNGKLRIGVVSLGDNCTGLSIVDYALTGTATDEGRVTFERRHYAENGTSHTTGTYMGYVYIVPVAKYTVDLDANASGATVTNTSMECKIGESITLPDASLNGYTFLGWYTAADSSGTRVGGSGSSYSPSNNITLYAHWEKITYGFVFDPATAYYNVNTNGILSHTPKFTMSDGGSTSGVTFSADLGKLTGLVSVDSSTGRIYGTLRNLMPSSGDGYLITLTAEKDGYDTGTQRIYVVVPTFTYELLDATLEVGEEYGYPIEANPTTAYISDAQVYHDNVTVSNAKDYVTYSGRNVTVCFDEEGVWEVILVISDKECYPTTKTLQFNVTPTTTCEEDPVITGITYAKHPTMEGGYFFTAEGANYYNTIVWTISNGTVMKGTETILTSFNSQGIVTVSCTVTNTTTNKTATASIPFNPVIEVDKSQAYINRLFAFMDTLPGTLSKLDIKTTPTQSWLNVESVEDSDGTVYYRVYGTCTNGSLVGTSVEVTVLNGSTTIDSWTMTICPDPNSEDTDFSTSINGYKVTLTNNGSTGLGMTMYIDWNGDGTSDQTVRGQSTVTHDYSTDFGAGTYNIIIEYVYYDIERTINKNNIVVPQNSEGGGSTGFTLSFNPSGGDGTMASMSGTSLTVPACTFTHGDREFLGWNTKADYSGKVYQPGDSIEIDSATTLYAMWSVSGGNNGDEEVDLMEYVPMIAIVVLVGIIAVMVVRQVL